jgi:hypothetical protein
MPHAVPGNTYQTASTRHKICVVGFTLGHEKRTTHGWHEEREVGDDGERAVELLVEAHYPQSVEGLYIRQTPAVEAARRKRHIHNIQRTPHPNTTKSSDRNVARCKEDALIGGSLAQRQQLVVRRRMLDVAVVCLQERGAHGVRAFCPNVSRFVVAERR